MRGVFRENLDARGAGMHVEEILERKGNQLYEIRPEQPVREAVAMMAARNIGTALVTDPGGALLGIISERDLIGALNEIGSSALDLRVSELMTVSVVTCTAETTIGDALSLMALHRIRHLPVVRDDQIFGLISVRDVLEFRLKALEENFAALNQAKEESLRAREAAELANRAKTEFLANVSHELKTPLNAIIGFAETLSYERYGRLDVPEYALYIREIEKSGRDLLGMVENLLDLSRIEIRALEPLEEAVNVPQLVSTCVRLISERAARNGVTIDVEADHPVPTVWADRRMMKQMLLNLLSNAVKFTPKGGTTSICYAADDSGLRLCIADTGVGIAPENLTKVVEPFHQVEPSTTRTYDGAGLGLALVNAMIRAHDGVLSLESKTGVGTVATLHFPPARVVATPQHRLSGQSEAA